MNWQKGIRKVILRDFWFAAKANPTSYKLFMSMLVLLGLLLLSPEMHGDLVAVAAPMT